MERMIVGRPVDELGAVLGDEGDVWIVDARDIDWSDPVAPQVDARFVQDFHRGDLWMRMAASNPDAIEVTGYPLDDGSTALVFDWQVGTKPIHEPTRIGISATPKGVTLFVRD